MIKCHIAAKGDENKLLFYLKYSLNELKEDGEWYYENSTNGIKAYKIR